MTAKIINIAENWIYQSNKLIESSYALTVTEHRLVLILASMIKKDDTEFEEYSFKVSDLVNLFGAKENRNLYSTAKQISESLMQQCVTIYPKDEEDPTKFTMHHIVETCKYSNGILTMRISKEMKYFYLQLEQYTKYKLKNIMPLKSSYSYRIYELLKQYLKLGTRTIDIDDFKLMLKLKDKYSTYGNIKSRILNAAQKEINEKTDLYFTFEEIKEGRKVVAVKFNIKQNDVQATKLEYRPPIVGEVLNSSNNYGYNKNEKIPKFAQFPQRNYTDDDFEDIYANGKTK